MTNDSTSIPAKLREMAARCTRLAAAASDARTIDALTDYARELLDEAARVETIEREGLAERANAKPSGE